MRLRVPWTFLRYFTLFLLVHVALTFLGVVGIFILLDLVDNLRAYTRFGAGGKELLLMYLYRLPLVAAQLAPAALLIGSLLSMYRFARRREFTAIEVAGIPPFFTIGCILLLGVGFFSCHLFGERNYLPRFRERADRYFHSVIVPKQAPLGRERHWFLYRNELWYLNQSGDKRELVRFRLEDGMFFGERYSLSLSEPYALVGIPTALRYPPRQSYTPDLTPQEISEFIKLKHPTTPEYQSFAELKEEIQEQMRRGEDSFPLWLELYNRISWALLNLSVILATLPFLPRHGKRAETARGIFVALVIAIVGWVFITIGGAIATSSRFLAGLFLPHFALLAIGGFGHFMRK